MPEDFYEAALKDERETALEAYKAIATDFQRYNTSQQKDAKKNALRFTLNILTVFYRNSRALNEKAHYDIYVDIYVKILAPHLDTEVSAAHFKRMLPLLEHLFSRLINYKLHAAAHSLYECIIEQQKKWCDLDDFKYLLAIHGNHMQMQCEATTTSNKEAINVTIEKISELFQHASLHCSELNSLDFINIFMQCFKLNTTLGRTLIMSLNSNQKASIFKAYFEILNTLSSKNIATTNSTYTADEAFQIILRSSHSFMQFDILDKLQLQLALQHVRICRVLPILEQHQYIKYCIYLLYNLLKLIYLRARINNFKETYERLCAEFQKLFTQTDKQLISEVWFQDFLILIVLLQIFMQPAKDCAYEIFWAQLDETLYATHFKLLYTIYKLLPEANKFNFVKYDCCKTEFSWRHNIRKLFCLCLETYTFMIKYKDFCNKEPFTSSLNDINEVITKIFKHTIQTLLDLDNNCKNSHSEMHRSISCLTNLMTEAKNPTQAQFFIKLAEYASVLKSHLEFSEWILFSRRLYQLGGKTNNANIAAELHCCHIAELIAAKNPITSPRTLHNQICFFYNGISAEVTKQGICLMDIYMQTTSVFKPLLERHEKRFLHWLEMQYILKYLNKDEYETLYINLTKRSLTKYDFILCVAAGSLLRQSSFYSKVQSIYEMLRKTKVNKNNINNNNKNNGLSRLEEVTFAHAAITLLTDLCKKKTTNLKSRDFHDENLSRLISEKILMDLSVNNEMELIEIALNALKAFQAFFEKADLEPLPKNEGSYLDWGRIVEDLISLATYFQLTGYMDYAIEAWLLLYRIAFLIGDIQSCVRGLAFFCEYNHLLNTRCNEHFNIVKEIEEISPSLRNNLTNLTQLLRRNQNFTLICLCQIAYFYATQQRINEAICLLKYVQKVHSELDRSCQYDIVLFTADIVQFRIEWKFSSKEHELRSNFLMCKFNGIWKRLESFTCISSVDLMPYDLLIIETSNEFAEYFANRLAENFLSGYFPGALKITTEMGAALRTAQLLMKWATMDLQMEYLQKAETKFQLIECILGLRNFDEMSCSLKKAQSVTSVENAKQSSPIMLHTGLEVQEVRKVAVATTTLKRSNKQQISPMAFDLKLKEYVDNSNNKNNNKNEKTRNLLLWTRFILGTLRARFNFMAKSYEELENYYERSKIWLSKRQDTFHYKMFQAQILINTINYAKYLRANKKYEISIELLEMSLSKFEILTYSRNIDPVYYLNLKQQLKETILEQLECKERKLPTKKRIVPEMMPTTPVNKSTRYAQIPMTTYPQFKQVFRTTPFQIYSDRKTTQKKSLKCDLLLSQTSSRKDLKFTEQEEKDKIFNEAINVNDTVELLSDTDTEEQIEEEIKKTPEAEVKKNLAKSSVAKAKSTKQIKTKKTRKSKEENIELVFEDLAIETTPKSKTTSSLPKSSTTSELKVIDEFKTPSPPQVSLTATNSVAPKRTKSIKKTASKSASSSENSSDTNSANSINDTTTEITTGMRRLRLRQTTTKTNNTKSSTSTSMRRPR